MTGVVTSKHVATVRLASPTKTIVKHPALQYPHFQRFDFFVGPPLQFKVVAVHQGNQPVMRGKKSLGVLDIPIPINKLVLPHQLNHCNFDPTIWNTHISRPPPFCLAYDFNFKVRKQYLSTSDLDSHKRITKVLPCKFQCCFVRRFLLSPRQEWRINHFAIQRDYAQIGRA